MIEDKRLRNFFGELLISRSKITSEYCIQKDNPVLQEDYFDELMNKEINAGLLKEFNKQADKPIKENDGDYFRFRKELFIFNPKYFKEVVETCIRLMPQEVINKIRSDE